MKKSVLLAVLFIVAMTIVSCKKDGSEESFGKPETTTEVQKTEDLGA